MQVEFGRNRSHGIAQLLAIGCVLQSIQIALKDAMDRLALTIKKLRTCLPAFLLETPKEKRAADSTAALKYYG